MWVTGRGRGSALPIKEGRTERGSEAVDGRANQRAAVAADPFSVEIQTGRGRYAPGLWLGTCLCRQWGHRRTRAEVGWVETVTAHGSELVGPGTP